MTDDDVDDRFRALMETEFGAGPALSPASPVAEEDDARGRTVPARIVPLSQLPSPRSWTPPEELDDGEGYKPEPLPPVGRLSSPAWLGIGLVVVGAVVLVGMLVDLVPRWWGSWVGLGGVCLGVLVLLGRLPRDRDDDEGGAVV